MPLIPNGIDDVATLGNVITANRTVTVDGSYTVGSLRFNDSSNYLLTGVGGKLSLRSSTGTATIANLTTTGGGHDIAVPLELLSDLSFTNPSTSTSSASTFRITGPISGAGSVSINGNVRMGGDSSYTGATILHSGTTTVLSARAFGALDGGNVIVNPNARISFQADLGLPDVTTKQIVLRGGALSGATFAYIHAPIVVESPSTIMNGIYVGAISGSGDLTLQGPSLRGNSTFTGKATVIGQVNVQHRSALGSPLVGTEVLETSDLLDKAVLNLAVPVSEPITLTGGTLGLFSPTGGPANTFDNPIFVNSGAITYGTSSGPPDVTLATKVLLGGPLTIESSNSGSRLIMTGGTAGSGDMEVRGQTVVVDGPLEHSGVTRVVLGTLEFPTNRTVERLELSGSLANVRTTQNAVLSLVEPRLLRGLIDADVRMTQPLVIDSDTGPTLRRLGAGFDQPIVVRRGTAVIVGIEGAGGTGAPTVVEGKGVVDVRTTLAEPFVLNDAEGLGLGALVGSGRIEGSVSLGPSGSTVGTTAREFSFTIAGPVSGGPLTINGVGRPTGGTTTGGYAATGFVTLANRSNTYSGATLVLPDGGLEITGDGRLEATSRIDVLGALRLEPAPAGHPGRIAPQVPISFKRAELFIRGGGEHELGAVSLGAGFNQFRFQNASPARLVLGSLARTPGSVLSVIVGDTVYSNDPIPAAVRFEVSQLPPTVQGIYPWAVTGTRFLAPDNGGSNALIPYTPNAGAVGGSTPSANVDLAASQTLSGDASINSLRIDSKSLNLGNSTLTIESGGIIALNASISGGKLVPGEGSGGEILVHGIFDSLSLGSSIVDSTRVGIPATSLVVAGSGTGNTVTLTGPSTYTGRTTISESTLALRHVAALPPSADLLITDGKLAVGPEVSLVRTGHLVVERVGSYLTTTAGQTPPPLEALSYTFEDGGVVYLPFVGDGPLVKRGNDRLILSTRMPEYRGSIDIESGPIETVGASALGTGVVRIYSAGTLNAQGAVLANPIELRGGTLSGRNISTSSDVFSTNSIDVLESSTLSTRGNHTGRFSVPAGVTVTVPRNASPTVTGDAVVHGSIVGTEGRPGIKFDPAPGKTVGGSGNLGGDLEVGGGAGVSPGGGVGKLSAYQGSVLPGGIHFVDVSDADATPGTGWDLLDISQSLTYFVSPDRFKVRLAGVDGTGTAGPVSDFDPGRMYSWPIVTAQALQFTDFSTRLPVVAKSQMFDVDASAFAAHNPFHCTFAVGATDTQLILHYLPGPLGDTDFDRRITADDYWRLDAGFLRRLTGYTSGDLNFDRRIDLDDYALIDASYLAQASATSAPVPEPAAAAVLVSFIPFARRRRRSRVL